MLKHLNLSNTATRQAEACAAGLRCYTLNGRAIALSSSIQNRFQTFLEAPEDHQKLSGTLREAVERPNLRNY